MKRYGYQPKNKGGKDFGNSNFLRKAIGKEDKPKKKGADDDEEAK